MTRSEFWCYEPSEIKYELLDPGVREVVRLLVAAGFHTTDSGDGESKRAKGWTEDKGLIPFPHVYMEVNPTEIAYQCERLLSALDSAGVHVIAQTDAWAEVLAGDGAGDSRKPRPYIEVTYDPVTARAVMGLFQVTSDMVTK